MVATQPKVYAIIPARGGSKGIPGKNLATVGGISLVARAVQTCLQVDMISEVFVSSDDPQILDEAQKAGGATLLRPPHLAPKQSLYQRTVGDGDPETKPITYSVLKHGVIGLTRYLATYWGRDSIRTIAPSPGGVANGQPADFLERLAEEIPLGRMANPDEIANVLVFLLSDDSRYINGSEVVVDGGRGIW